ncbi:uncharacterized protein N7459_008751 [Penicillium hispanicum]|uniref:uncharacterized protein n=1 Tax=Penicillium hispanicum TaxID=1080232 RepID=UPI00253FDC9E|nr:uncharacterized protein N7459_008751 [Penicillium hispanicum]KAJ5574324.1 hypothetical protein N7459_008751 [Penicillium hispanicum]
MESSHLLQIGSDAQPLPTTLNEPGGPKRKAIPNDVLPSTDPIQGSEQTNETTQCEPPQKKSRRSRYEVEPDYSEMQRAKARLQNEKENKRMSNACDRCKVRKLRCDSRKTGCQPCFFASLPCNHTNMMTAETLARGETEKMRARIADLEGQVQKLQEEIERLQGRNNSSTRQFNEALSTIYAPLENPVGRSRILS